DQALFRAMSRKCSTRLSCCIGVSRLPISIYETTGVRPPSRCPLGLAFFGNDGDRRSDRFSGSEKP
ncbi:MAG: hypothetical protein AB7I59_30105, partial [Geminicoccaceae bacterium]